MLLSVAVLVVGLSPADPATATASTLPAAKTFVSTGTEQTYHVPAGVVAVLVRAVGGFGGPVINQGGDGEDLTAYLPVTPKQRLYTEVGQTGVAGGAVGFGGGGASGSQSNGLTGAGSGGGATDVRTCSQRALSCPGGGTSRSSRLIVAGGGGGAGGDSPSQFDACGGGGGAGGANSSSRVTTSDGTFVLGIDGTAGTPSTPSRGGTNLAPGAGGSTPGCNGGDSYSGSAAGSSGSGPAGGSGGSAPSFAGGGGGGGGGYFAGGGGASGNEICNVSSCFGGSNGAGGGGGSSFVTSLALPSSFGGASGAPMVTYTPEIAINTPANGAAYTLGQVIDASYTCDAAVFSTCTGTVASGQAVDTSTIGTHSFVVQGTIGAQTLTGTVTYKVAKRSTSTTVTCTPTSVLTGQATSCTAVVTDTSPVGTPVPPTGRVGFSSDGAGTFSPLKCTLAQVSPSSAHCSDTYVPSATGSPTITAQYSSDPKHKPSTGTTTISVGSPPGARHVDRQK